ncbi:MAG: hypothetical protein ACFFG0_47790 [Candidatus Thorarchaeota archaeon]
MYIVATFKVITERLRTEEQLKNTIETLEKKVEELTKKLQESEEK